jgi:hypothetical protein
MKRHRKAWAGLVAAAALLFPAAALAEAAPFDLAGPQVEVKVTRAGRTLPIGEVPTLAPGDQVWIKADLPEGQAVRYLLVTAFLRGATNPPPEKWLSQSRTWTPEGANGLRVTVPHDARQMLVFLAPAENGDFNALRGAVRSRPGAFVRASQDLHQATLDRSRLDAYVAAIRKTSESDPDALKTSSPLLARSLAIKLDPECLRKAVEAQASCLTSGQEALVLNDAHGSSMVQSLTTGDSAELMQQLSATARAGSGYYSPYVTSLMDLARILDGFRTAQYQYIPALGVMHEDRLSLLLNSPPSFQTPKSVLVMALPPVTPSPPPPLHAVAPDAASCLEAPSLTLAAEGAPLIFSTDFAHNLVLRVKTKKGATFDLPVRPDAEKGGLAVDAAGAKSAELGPDLVGRLHGEWGFDAWDGPEFKLAAAATGVWRIDAKQDPITAGADRVVRLRGDAGCVRSVTFSDAAGRSEPVVWKVAGADVLEATLPLKDVRPGAVVLTVSSFGAAAPQVVPLSAGALALRLDGFVFHAGDVEGALKGQGLDAVRTITLGGAQFTPSAAADPDGGLLFAARATPAAEALTPGAVQAEVALKDGRTVGLPVEVLPPRPRYQLIAKSVSTDAHARRITLTSADELPWNSRLTFSVRAEAPLRFTGGETIELATTAGAQLAVLKPGDGLMLEDDHVAVATVDLSKALGASAFGPLRFRVVKDGAAGDWASLGRLVRLPRIDKVHCGRTGPCEVQGDNLFLVAAVAEDPGFKQATTVPEGFTDDTLQAPRPKAGRIYLRLRDDPEAVNTLAVGDD